jgi:hypothetical protein
MSKPGGCHSSGISLGDVLRLPKRDSQANTEGPCTQLKRAIREALNKLGRTEEVRKIADRPADQPPFRRRKRRRRVRRQGRRAVTLARGRLACLTVSR